MFLSLSNISKCNSKMFYKFSFVKEMKRETIDLISWLQMFLSLSNISKCNSKMFYKFSFVKEMKRETIDLISWLQIILSLSTCSHKKELRSSGFRPLVPIKRRDHKSM